MYILFCRYHPVPVTYGQQVHQLFPRSHCKVSKHPRGPVLFILTRKVSNLHPRSYEENKIYTFPCEVLVGL